MANYDEDLYDNPFFLTIHKQFATLFNNAVAEKALVRLNYVAYIYIFYQNMQNVLIFVLFHFID